MQHYLFSPIHLLIIFLYSSFIPSFLHSFMIIYGIKNCDTMQKAFKFLDKKKIKYTFHDYKKEGIDKETIKRWLNYFPVDKIINTKSATFKSLSEEEKTSITNKNKAMNLMMKNTSMIKRPLLDMGEENFLQGFNEEEWSRLVNY